MRLLPSSTVLKEGPNGTCGKSGKSQGSAGRTENRLTLANQHSREHTHWLCNEAAWSGDHTAARVGPCGRWVALFYLGECHSERGEESSDYAQDRSSRETLRRVDPERSRRAESDGPVVPISCGLIEVPKGGNK